MTILLRDSADPNTAPPRNGCDFALTDELNEVCFKRDTKLVARTRSVTPGIQLLTCQNENKVNLREE